MIEFIKGKLVEKSPTNLLVLVGGIGYRVEIPTSVYDLFACMDADNKSIEDRASQVGVRAYPAIDEVQLYTHFIVRENAQQLYGFYNKQQRDVFRALIGVSGIGPNTARMLLSKFSEVELLTLISEEKVSEIKKAKGIGPKTASRLVLELKDKVTKLFDFVKVEVAEEEKDERVEQNTEATEALVQLGYSVKEAKSRVAKVLKSSGNISISELIKQALN